MDKMIKVSEAAEILGVSAATIRRLANEKILKTYRIAGSGHRRFRIKDVHDLLSKSQEN